MSVRVYRRKDSKSTKYQYEFHIPGQKPTRESSRTSIKKDAERIAQAAYAKALLIAKGVIPAEGFKVAAVTLGTLQARYLEFAKLHHPSTGGTDTKRTVDRFVEIVGAETLVPAIDEGEIDDWRLVRGKQTTRRGNLVKPSTINRELDTIAAMFTKAVAWKYISESPCTDLEDFETDDHPVHVFTAAQLDHAFAHLPAPYNLWCELTYRTLGRLREVACLRSEHVEIERRADGIQIAKLTKRVKGGKWKRVAIPLVLGKRLRAHVTAADQEFVFPDFHDTGSNSAMIIWHLRKLGLAGSHHSYRHTGITRMLDRGISPRAIQEHAGWSNLRQLERYGHVLDQEFARAVQVTDDFLVDARAEAAAAVAEGTTGGAA